jgi:hypothetical protein
MTIPAACTTAAAVRRNTVEPAMDGLVRAGRRLELIAQIQAATTELATLADEDRDDLRLIAGFTDQAARRLDVAERAGSYNAVDLVSEMPNARHVAQRVNAAIDTLAGSPTRPDRAAAQDDLHAIFETFGDALFEQRYAYHIGKKRLLTVRGELDRWTAGHRERQAV